MVTILATIFVLGVLIFAHEAGHFVVAKLMGIRVLRFSLGFGKVLAAFTWRGTEYALSMFPFGGYVKMAGGDERESEGRPDEFLAKPPWVRMFVAVAGPAMNVVLAIVVFAVIAKVGYETYTASNRIGEVLETVELDGREVPTPARLAGFKEGDVIVAVNGKATPYWVDVQRAVFPNAGKRLGFDVKRGGKLVKLEAEPALEPETGRGILGVAAYQTNDVLFVSENSLASRAGVEKGDRLAAFDGRPVASPEEFTARLEDLPPGPHEFTFASARGAKVVTVDYGEGDLAAFFEDLGVIPGLMKVKRSASWLGAVPAGWRLTWETATGIARGLAWVFKGRVKVTKALGGPISIALFAGERARAGIIPLLAFIGSLSIMLAMVNLLPVPVLDGGHILIGTYETVRGKNLSVRARELITYVGLAFIAAIVALALVADFTRVFTKPG